MMMVLIKVFAVPLVVRKCGVVCLVQWIKDTWDSVKVVAVLSQSIQEIQNWKPSFYEMSIEEFLGLTTGLVMHGMATSWTSHLVQVITQFGRI